MIKIRLKRNLIYLLMLYVSFFIRKIVSFIIDNIYSLNAPYLYLYMMTLGEILGGTTIYLYHFANKRNEQEVKYFGIQLIHNAVTLQSPDGMLKKMLLIFFAGCFDIYEFILLVFFVPKLANISPTAKTRLGCLATIISALICVYALGFKIEKHQKFSLIILGACFIMTVILELIFKPEDQPMDRFILAHFLVFLYLGFIPCNDCAERYLAYYDYLNPFFILMTEGTLEFILSIFYSINEDPFKEIVDEYHQNDAVRFFILIFLLIIYTFLSAVVNAYKVYCNVIYTPMARTLAEYFLNPVLNIYYLLIEKDFHNNYLYFSICEIICIIIDFSFYIFNEYIILSCCGLEFDTGDEIHRRANDDEKNALDDCEEEDTSTE